MEELQERPGSALGEIYENGISYTRPDGMRQI